MTSVVNGQSYISGTSYPPQPSGFDEHTMNTSLGNSFGQNSTPNSSSSSSSQQSTMYNMSNHSADHLDFPDPATSHYAQHSLSGSTYSTSSHVSHAGHAMTLNPASLNTNIDTDRVMTRRQAARVAQQQAAQGVDLSMHNHSTLGTLPGDQTLENQHRVYYVPSDISRPPTPNDFTTNNPYREHLIGRPDITIQPNGLPIRSSMSSSHPSTPSNPASFSSFHPYASLARSTSNSTYPRSASPAMSVMSLATTLSSSSSNHHPHRLPSGSISPLQQRTKQRKSRLMNVDRKAICKLAEDYPNMRQEEIAARFKVERSTVSKILKNKHKWLTTPVEEDFKVARHRTSKFPSLEEDLVNWLRHCSETGTAITDAMIRLKAKEAAKRMQIGEDKFKASAGWVENFKHRQGVRRGVWVGVSKYNNDTQDAMENDSNLTRGASIRQGQDQDHIVVDGGRRGEMGPPDLEIEMIVDPEINDQDQLGRDDEAGPAIVSDIQWRDQQGPRIVENNIPSFQESDHGTMESQQDDGSLSSTEVDEHSQDSPHDSGILQHSTDLAEVVQQLVGPNGPGHFDEDGVMRAPPDPDIVVLGTVSAKEADRSVDVLITFVRQQPESYLDEDETEFLAEIKKRIFNHAYGNPDCRVERKPRRFNTN